MQEQPQLCADLREQLAEQHELIATASASEALHLLAEHPGIAVIIADLRLPDMDGAIFLARTRALAPNAARILVADHADLQSTTAAINDAQILRFLSKPYQRADLHAAIQAALEQQRDVGLDGTAALRRVLSAQLAAIDPVTGLSSRTRFIELLEAFCADADRHDRGNSYAVWIIHLENMRDLSDLQSCTAADQLLQALAQRLREHCPAALCLARWGDEHFAVLLPSDLADEKTVLSAAEALIRQLAMPIRLSQGSQWVRACVGIAGVPAHTGDARTALKFADIASRQAAARGGGIACLFHSEWAYRITYRHELLAALREALDGEALHLHYQPIVDLKNGTVMSLEALARWTHPTLGPIAPAEFISLAEESGEMPRLGQWILRRACREARALVGRYCARVAVNISVQQLLHDGFLAQLDDALREANLHPQELEIELTESVLATDVERSLALLTQLRKRGVSIAIDDFGTGYSSLAYLQRFPADLLKVDSSFVATLGQGGETIISAALSIGRSFGMKVVIEGVETELARRQLAALGATLFQGYVYGKPMSPAAVDQWFLRSAFAAAASCVPGEQFSA